MTTPDANRSPRAGQPPSGDGTVSEQLAQIQELQRQTLALLRQIAELLIPKGDPDKPRLEDLIAALVGQQTGMLLLLKQIAAGVAEALDRLPVGTGAHGNGLRPNGLQQ